jgi:hypothetical protein
MICARWSSWRRVAIRNRRFDYRLQADRKTREGSHNPAMRNSATSTIGCVGDFKNAGRDWRPKSSPEEVRVHHFVVSELGRVAPYGVYDIAGTSAG